MAIAPAESPPASGGGGNSHRPSPWDLLLQVAGAGAAIAGWIAVVGGARVWARLHAADIPATQTLSVLPRELLIVEGLQALLVPLVIGGGLAVVVYFWRTDRHGHGSPETPDDPPPPSERERLSFRDWIRETFAESAPASVLKGLDHDYEPTALAGMGALAAVGLLVLTLAIVQVQWWWVVGATGLGLGLATFARVGPAQEGDQPVPDPTSRRVWVLIAAAVVLVAAIGAVAAAPGWEKWEWLAVGIGVAAALALVAGAGRWYPESRGLVAAIAVVVAPLVGVIVALSRVVRPGYLVAIGLLTVALVWLLLGALSKRPPKGVAWTLFAALALWSGAIGFLREAGAREPQLESADVVLEDGTRLTGFYLGRNDDAFYVATDSPRRVRVLEQEEVASLDVGERTDAKPAEERDDARDDDGPEGSRPKTKDLPIGPAGARKFLRAVDTIVGRVELRLEIFEPRRSGKLLVLDLRLTNLSDEEGPATQFAVGNLLDDGAADARGATSDTVDGLEISDGANKMTYPVARTEDGRCLCTRNLSRITLRPGESVFLWAAFKRPPDDAELELHAPQFPTLDLGDGTS